MSYRQGDIVIVLFPYSDLSNQKQRPAIVLSSDNINSYSSDVVLAQITSQIKNDDFSFYLDSAHLTIPLIKDSEVRCHKIFTAEKTIIKKSISSLLPNHLKHLIVKISSEIIGCTHS
jgi:mRNA interferase MazF